MVVEATQVIPTPESSQIPNKVIGATTPVVGASKTNEEPKVRSFSWSEIAKHKSENDCWIVVKGKVYDVSSWVPNHPGGKLILNGGGRESTALFVSYHPLRVEKMLATYEIGKVDDYRPFYDWEKSDFYPVLKRRVETYIKENGMERDSKLMYFKTLLVMIGWLVSYYFGVIKGYYLSVLLCGIFHSHFGITIGHDGNHGAFSKAKGLNNWAARAMDIMGGSSIVWIHQHNVGHHPNSNRQGDSCKSECDQFDPDAKSGAPIVRIAPGQPLMWWHKWQHLYIWVLFTMVTSKWFFNDVRTFMRKSYLNIEMFELNKTEFYVLAASKVSFFLYMILVPLMIHPAWKAASITALFMATTSYYFVLMFSVNHLTEDAYFPDGDTQNRDWARLQVLTSSNFAVGSELWTWLSGGLNYQIEHHLFPGVCHTYLPFISPIVQQTCKEYNIPYTSFPSYADALYSHYTHLKLLGNPELAEDNKKKKKQ